MRRRLEKINEILKSLCLSGKIRRAVGILFSSPAAAAAAVDASTYALLLQETIHRREAHLGMRIHSHILLTGFSPDYYLTTKLLIFYAKHGFLDTARYLFDTISHTNTTSSSLLLLVPWNAIISGHVNKGLECEALGLYYSMRSFGVLPDHFTFASVLRACSKLALLEHGKRAHCVIIKIQVEHNVVVDSALVDMYFKCSCPLDGHRAFICSPEKNVVTWTALISGYGLHGCVAQVLALFHRMLDEGFRPNSVTFLAVLSACSHGGLVDAGWKYFFSMTTDYKIKPKAKHYAAMVDLLGRSGRLNEALKLVKKSGCEDHSVIWGALLGSCKIHGHIELVRLAARKFFEVEPANAGKYVVLSNTFAASEMWDEVADVRGMIRRLGIIKEPAWSCIEVQGKVHTFLVRDSSHERSNEIYATLKILSFASMESGYITTIIATNEIEEASLLPIHY